jgi:hypothetical protein
MIFLCDTTNLPRGFELGWAGWQPSAPTTKLQVPHVYEEVVAHIPERQMHAWGTTHKTDHHY